MVNKKNFIIGFIAALFWGSLSAQTSQDSRLAIGYCGEKINTGIGFEKEIDFGGAICLPAAKMAIHKNEKIVAIRVGLFDYIGSNCRVFISKKLGDEAIYEQPVENLEAGWNCIELDQPQTIDGDTIYIGILSKCGIARALGVTTGEANTNADWFANKGKWRNFSKTNQTLRGALCIEAIVKGGEYTQASKDLIDLEELIPQYIVRTGENIQFIGRIKSNCIENIKNLKLSYEIDDREPVSLTIDNLNLENRQKVYFSIESDATVTTGMHKVRIQLFDINGSGTPPTLNSTYEYTFNAIDEEFYWPTGLLEQFTGMACSNCPLAERSIRKVLGSREDVIWISHHVGYEKDLFTIEDSEEFLRFYGSSYPYAPAVMLNRSIFDYPNPIFGGEEEIKINIQKVLSAPAYVQVSGIHNYDPYSRTLSITGMAKKLDKFGQGSDVRLNIYLIENELEGRQVGRGEVAIHDHVVRKIVSKDDNIPYGEKIIWENNEFHSKEYKVIIPEEWIISNMKIVMFIANYNSQDINDCNIYNAWQSPIINGVEISEIPSECLLINHLSNTNELIFPKSLIKETYTIYTSSGEIIRKGTVGHENLFLGAMPPGLYLVRCNKVSGKFIVR